jgi:signal transduction histidine kinase
MLVTQLKHPGIGPRGDDGSPLDRAERRALRLLALHEVALAIGGQSDPAHTLELILSQARSLLNAPAGSIYLWEERSGLLRCTLAHHTPDSMLGGTVLPGEGSVGAAFRDCKTVMINNYRAWTGASAMGRDVGVEAAISVPLRMGERLLGALTVHTYEPGQTFDEEDAWMLELLGDQAAMALEQARLVEQAERRAARLLALHRVSAAISGQPDIRTTLALILPQAAELLKRKGGAIYLWDEASQLLVLAEGHGLPVHALDQSVSPGEGITGQVWLQGKSLIVDDYPNWEHATERGRAAGLISLAGVPLSVAGRPIGVLAMVAEDNGAPFTAEEVQVLELFAGQAAIAIENARLFEAAARARAMEELDRLKSEFVSTVSHELRTPLTYIHGYSELLLGHRLKPEMVSEAAGEIHEASSRMTRLVDDLLDLSRLEAGRLRLRLTRLNLGDLLRSAAAAARFQSPDRPIELDIAPLPEITADPARLRQVVDNLLNNAQRYAPSSVVTLRARPVEGGVRVEIADRGPGISPEDQARVFEPFYRGAKSEVSPLRGGGLGLAIVRRLVEAHGGRVGLESSLGHGSTFWFALPLEVTE